MARIPRKKTFTLTIDLLADWHPYASEPAPVSLHQPWTYFGTITYNGITGALAWRYGWYGMAVGEEPVIELPLWERIRIQQILDFGGLARRAGIPRFPRPPEHSTTGHYHR